MAESRGGGSLGAVRVAGIHLWGLGGKLAGLGGSGGDWNQIGRDERAGGGRLSGVRPEAGWQE